MTSSNKKETKTVTAKLATTGDFTDDKGEVIARIGDDGKVEARRVSEEKQDGKTMKTEATYIDVGNLDDAGVFTIKKDGKTITIDDKGKVVGLPPDVAITVTAAPAQRKAAMFVVVAMFAASKASSDISTKGGPAAVPAKK